MKKKHTLYAKKYFINTTQKKDKTKKKCLLNKDLINDILYAKSIAYHALFIMLKVDMCSNEDLYNIDTRYVHKISKKISIDAFSCYILLEALDRINSLLQLHDEKLIWYTLFISMYKITTILSKISIHTSLNELQNQCLKLLASGNKKKFTWEKAMKKCSESNLKLFTSALTTVNTKLLDTLIPIFAGCNRFPINKDNLLINYEKNFRNINVLDISTHNRNFTLTQSTKKESKKYIDTLYEIFKSEHWKK